MTKEQRIAAVKHYYQSSENGAEASRRMTTQFGISSPQGRNITALVKKFELTGSVADAQRPGRPSTATTTANGDRLAEALHRSPQKSSRRLARELGISQWSVLKLLKSLRMKPYIPRLVQALHECDPDRRMEFAECFLQNVSEDSTYIDKIWWSDEAIFKLNGHINRHNCVYWSAENPHVAIEKEVNLPGVTVWCAISSSGIIGPFFFDTSVSSQSYLTMLKEKFWPCVQHQEAFFQQDGAPPHYGAVVREWLNENFGGRWIGRRGPIEWPPRSPDLSPCDFFLWGVMKDRVYGRNPRSIEELKDAITTEISAIDVNLCKTVCRSVTDRLRQCLAADGQQFEYLC